jgi:uncharacterized protein (UPF0335 family)
MASKKSSNIAAEPTIGHNSSMSSDDRDQLKNFIARIEALAEERDQLSEDIKSIHAEAKSQGYDIKDLREIIRIREKDPDEVAVLQSTIHEYMQALQGLIGIPPGDHAISRAGSGLTPPV